jgi:site-specific recombinase XerD
MAKIEKEIRRYVKSYQTQKGTRWKVIIPDGRGNQIREQGFLEESHAASFAVTQFRKILLQEEKIDYRKEMKITFAEYADQWLISKERDGLASTTISRYRDQIKSFIDPFFGSMKIAELEKYHLRNYISESYDRGVTSYNINSSVTLFKMIIRQAIEDDFVHADGILTVKTPRHRASAPRFWDQVEMRFFLNAVAESKWFQLWKLVLNTGMRGGEVAALKWESVHFDMSSGEHVGYIKVCRTCRQKTREIRETTKNGDNRMIPILPELREMLIEMKEKAKGDFVFGDTEPLDPSHFSRLLKQDLRRIPELKPINFHGLRHTFCSYLDSTGMSRRIVAEIMGHRDLSTTDRYSHVSNQVLGSEVLRWTENRSKQKSNNISLVAL